MSLRQRSSVSVSNINQPSTSGENDEITSLIKPSPQPSPNPPQGALYQALESLAHLANLLPTGTLLAFQILTPIFTKYGSCDAATGPMTLALLLVLAISCFLASFTDSIKANDGQVYHGIATFKGLWLFDYTTAAASGLPDLTKYKLNFIDVVHAVLSVLVFAAVALRDKNVASCFYPKPGVEVREVLHILPIGVGFISSLLFVVFPTKRHGIGYPVTRDK
ncbi:hypothetical protein CDL12_18303 [Handroanthus impetiginosus]|uniref:Uncharacterized protein n=1 Tax=Handroanthus impetiginosus TaxID=429701 RepID=A0A2G9GV14_9LAMI|nr:hypothetical protein CDL12_18303 [Handroanthus impetiginosus]